MTVEKYITLFETILASGVKKNDAMEVATNSLEMGPGETIDWTLMTQAMNAVYHGTPTEMQNQVQVERDLHDHKSTKTH